MNDSTRKRFLWAIVALTWAWAAQAAVKPNNLFSDGVVLQQGIAVPVWGSAGDGEKITVKIGGQSVATTAKDGRWEVRLQPLKAGGPFTMTIAGENAITITNVLVGEVWICSGQSNMAFGLGGATTGADAIASSSDPLLRLLTVPHGNADEPVRDVVVKWQESDQQSAKGFSAVGYFFGRDLRKALKVPVGLIHTSVGGTPAEAWTPRSALEAKADLKQIIEESETSAKKWDKEKAEAKYQEDVAKHKLAVEKAKAEGKEPPRPPRPPVEPKKNNNRPSGLYNAMVAPLEPFAIRGAIWYQGESNNGRAAQYRTLFPTMIESWRKAWGQGEFPFLFVQIAPHNNMSPELREAQLLTTKTVSHTAMAVITDCGNAADIHPRNKEPVGGRLALAARAIAYGEKIEYIGPAFTSMKIDGNRAVLTFSHVGTGLIAKEGALKGFTITGADKKFLPADAEIKGNTVIVTNKEITAPVAVRYGWANVPDVNLYNKEGLPASPFRTDVER